ncbi:AcaB family transcriptional regulator, partial [Pseudomonas aeruginosa]|uniref:AcaB family transcriptional regulator n=1 Tax=Pseudomonas aeruginosa TaxID=287 RepID=UPI000BC3F7B1
MSRRRDDDEPALPAEIPQRRTMYFLLLLGLSGFCAYVNRMHRGAAQDDPYSDWWLVQIEEKVENCQAALKAIDQR